MPSRVIVALLTVAAGSLLHAQNSGKITGKVTNALTHRPIAKVHVSCTIGSKFAGVLTAEDGSYVLDELPAGPVRMTVNLEDYRLIIEIRDMPPAFSLGPGETVTRDFELHPLGRIYGKLLDRDSGNPIDGYPVSALIQSHHPGHSSFSGRVGEPSKGGEFEIRNLEPGDYVVAVDAGAEPKLVFGPALNEKATTRIEPRRYYGQRSYPDVPLLDMATPIHLGEGESRNVDMAIQSREPHAISGTIEAPPEFERQPLSLSFRTGIDSGLPRNIEMPTRGPFRIENLAPGSYWLTLTAGKKLDDLIGLREDEASADYHFEITDHDEENVKIVLALGAGVTGDVHMQEGDAPLPQKLSMLLLSTSGWFAQLKSGGSTVSGIISLRSIPVEAGRFRQESIRPGEYWPQLMGLPDGYSVAQVLFTGSTSRYSAMTLTAPDTGLTFVLTSHPGAIAGVVRDHDQAPLKGAEVILLPDPVPDKAGPAAILAEDSGDDGGFVFRNLAPGNYRAVVLTPAEQASEGDMVYLGAQAARADPIEVRAGQTAVANLTH